MKKTIAVSDIKATVNNMIINSQDDDKQGRESLIVLIESVLMETGNYKGFKYLSPFCMQHSKNGVSVGIMPDADDKFANTDHTRVMYF